MRCGDWNCLFGYLMKDSILLKILVAASIAIVMAVTNPDKGDFAFYANNHIKKLYPNIDTTIKKEDDDGEIPF